MQNIYDNNDFFNAYQKLRENPYSANILEEKPALYEYLPSVDGAVVLDLGCGAGGDTLDLLERGAQHVHGVDISQNMIQLAQNTVQDDRATFQQLPMENLHTLPPTSYDVVFSSLAMHYIQDFHTLCKNVSTLLTNEGYFYFSQEHPIFTAPHGGAVWQVHNDGMTNGMVISDYPDDGLREASWLDTNVVKYHRTVSTVLNTLIDTGFVIERVVEPKVTSEAMNLAPELARVQHVPDYLIVKARKQ